MNINRCIIEDHFQISTTHNDELHYTTKALRDLFYLENKRRVVVIQDMSQKNNRLTS